MSKTTAIVFIIVFALEAAFIIIGNAFAIFFFWTQTIRVKQTCFLLINLAVVDVLVGIAEAMVFIIKSPCASRRIRPSNGLSDRKNTQRWKRKKTRAKSLGSISGLFSGTSVMFLALISLKHVYAVLRPLRHRITSTRAYTYNIVIIWATGLCLAGLWLLAIYHSKVNSVYATVKTQSFLFVFLLVICGSFLMIRSPLHCTAPELEGDSQNASERNLRLSKTFFIVVAVSLVLWFPAYVVHIVKEFCPRCFSPNMLSSATVLHLANFAVNPVVYSFSMPIFKEALQKCTLENDTKILN